MDQNFLYNLEKSIKDKYGEETIKNPKADWTQEKEKSYLEQLKHLEYKSSITDEMVNINGVFIPQKLFIKENNKNCVICKSYSLKKDDDIYLSKYGTCFKCFLERIEGREEKWKNK